jgi:hypothetical protein
MLKDRQLAAIDLIAGGAKGKDVEQAVGVSHAQLHRWKLDPEFDARLEQVRASIHQQRVDKFWLVIDGALDVALEALAEGDPEMARDLIRLAAPGLSDVRRVPREAREASEQPRAELTPGMDPGGHRCETCGKVCRNAGGLAKHRRTHAA